MLEEFHAEAEVPGYISLFVAEFAEALLACEECERRAGGKIRFDYRGHYRNVDLPFEIDRYLDIITLVDGLSLDFGGAAHVHGRDISADADHRHSEFSHETGIETYTVAGVECALVEVETVDVESYFGAEAELGLTCHRRDGCYDQDGHDCDVLDCFHTVVVCVCRFVSI